MPLRSPAPLRELVLSRFRLFLREPAAVFWVYGFPVVMLIALGVAFRENPQEQITVDVVDAGGGREVAASLAKHPQFKVTLAGDAGWQKRLQYGKTDLVIEAGTGADAEALHYWEEPRRTESRLARYAVAAALAARDRPQAAAPEVSYLQSAGSRYIDFLLPGMIGMGLMGGGLWGVGFVVVDMRVRKLLKRLLATPMKRSDFLVSIMLSRIVFTIVDIVFLLVVGYVIFGVRCQGSYLDLSLASVLGATSFAGLGLLISCRAQTLETVSGLMNLVLLPMWVLSGVFFSSERFPEAAQPFINLLPLTALNQVLRGIMLEADPLFHFWPQVLLLLGYAVVTFAIALRIFRWK